MNTNETTDKQDDNQAFRSPDEVEQTIRHFSARNVNMTELRKDSNEELNQLRKDIETYIQDLLDRMKDEIFAKMETSGTGEKGEKGDRGATGATGATGTSFNASDYFEICS